MSKTQAPLQRYVLRDIKGNLIELRGDLTIEDLIRMGFDDIRLVNPDHPPSVDRWISDQITIDTRTWNP